MRPPCPVPQIDRASPGLILGYRPPGGRCFSVREEGDSKLFSGSPIEYQLVKDMVLHDVSESELVASRVLTVIVGLTIAANLSFPLSVLLGVVR